MNTNLTSHRLTNADLAELVLTVSTRDRDHDALWATLRRRFPQRADQVRVLTDAYFALAGKRFGADRADLETRLAQPAIASRVAREASTSFLRECVAAGCPRD